uniref:Uncharacterized protein n=1 Tax=Opuntia streptacantha TaxID=393608 RepID=A0A7C9DCR6_OPUST
MVDKSQLEISSANMKISVREVLSTVSMRLGSLHSITTVSSSQSAVAAITRYFGLQQHPAAAVSLSLSLSLAHPGLWTWLHSLPTGNYITLMISAHIIQPSLFIETAEQIAQTVNWRAGCEQETLRRELKHGQRPTRKPEISHGASALQRSTPASLLAG